MAPDGLLMAGHLPDMCPVHVQGQAAAGIHVRPAADDGIWSGWVCRRTVDAYALFRTAWLRLRMGGEVFLLCLLSATSDGYLALAIVSLLSDVP